MKPVVSIFVFRRDLRTVDNLALNKLVNDFPGVPILPIFVFNPVQISPSKNSYYSNSTVQFMVESLKDLKIECGGALLFFHGYDIPIFELLLKSFTVQAVGFNVDYTPFARSRDEQLRLWCSKRGVPCVEAEDYTLFPMGAVMTGSKKPYEVFTPFYRAAMLKATTIPPPSTKPMKFHKAKHPSVVKDIDVYVDGGENRALAVRGGRENALFILERVARKDFARYENTRNFPAKETTTKLSAYLKFGCVSVREVFQAMKKAYGVDHGLVRELMWREFFAHTAFHFPGVLDGQAGGKNKTIRAMKTGIDVTKEVNIEYWRGWCQGRTGYPFVDAGMRQLNTTGWMHNRLRMVTSMFLTKDLEIDWRLGEQYFASKLVDYDPASNSGGWQGTENLPPFRSFSPVVQAQRFDSDAEYVKRWVPELRDVPAKDILAWETAHVKHSDKGYLAPLVFHKGKKLECK